MKQDDAFEDYLFIINLNSLNNTLVFKIWTQRPLLTRIVVARNSYCF